MRRTLLALLLAFSASPVPALAQYLGPAQPVPQPPAPPPDATDEAEPPPAPAPAPPPRPGALPPGQGSVPEWSVRRIRLWGTLGATFAYGQGAVGLGAGIGYFVVGGLLPTLDLGLAFGSSPTVFMVKPGLDWFLPVPGGVVPFLVGFYFSSVSPAAFLLGIAYERVFTNCSGTCAYWVPQVAAGFAL